MRDSQVDCVNKTQSFLLSKKNVVHFCYEGYVNDCWNVEIKRKLEGGRGEKQLKNWTEESYPDGVEWGGSGGDTLYCRGRVRGSFGAVLKKYVFSNAKGVESGA